MYLYIYIYIYVLRIEWPVVAKVPEADEEAPAANADGGASSVCPAVGSAVANSYAVPYGRQVRTSVYRQILTNIDKVLTNLVSF